jgi:hypothetical protein
LLNFKKGGWADVYVSCESPGEKGKTAVLAEKLQNEVPSALQEQPVFIDLIVRRGSEDEETIMCIRFWDSKATSSDLKKIHPNDVIVRMLGHELERTSTTETLQVTT